jgi:hypothetical protein
LRKISALRDRDRMADIRKSSLRADAVEKGKNELIKVFTYARVETVIS